MTKYPNLGSILLRHSPARQKHRSVGPMATAVPVVPDTNEHNDALTSCAVYGLTQAPLPTAADVLAEQVADVQLPAQLLL